MSVKITCALEEKRSWLKRRLHGHDGKKIDLKRTEQKRKGEEEETREKGEKRGEWSRWEMLSPDHHGIMPVPAGVLYGSPSMFFVRFLATFPAMFYKTFLETLKTQLRARTNS